MLRRLFFVSAVILTAAVQPIAPPALAQAPSALAGTWSLNRSLSEFPREMAFDFNAPAIAIGGTPSTGSTGGGRGRRGGGGNGQTFANPFSPRGESYEDGQRMRILLGEVRNPPASVTIVDSTTAVTITDELGHVRVLHPTGREEVIHVENIPITVTSRREGSRLIALYHVEDNRDVRWTYSPSTSPVRLAVEAQLLERGKGDKATRVYEPELRVTAPPAPRTSTEAARGEEAPAAGRPAAESFDQRPGAEFAGLNSLGILVEDLGPEARACGLRRDAIEEALAKRLGAGGLTVRKNSDDDTYVYVTIATASVANGTCVSRYDAFLYTHATSKLSYHDRPVLVQVSLLHRGGIGASGSATHSASVLRGLEGYVDLIVTQIRNANK